MDAASGNKSDEDTEALVSRPANDIEPEMELGAGDPSVEALAGVDESLADSFGNVDDVDVTVVTSGVDVDGASPDDVEEVLAVDAVDAEEPSKDGEAEEAEVEAKEGGDEPQSFLAMYFRDMAELDVLRPEQEFETARHIEQLELELWHILLGYGPGGNGVADIVETAMAPQVLPEFKTYRAFVEKNKRKATLSSRKGPDKVIVELGAKLKEVDIDRIFVEAAAAEIQRLSRAVRGERHTGDLPDYASAKGFLEFADAAASKMARVKRAKNEFVKANLRLVVSIARRFNHGRLPLPDLIQEGNIGLMKAVERYDYRRGFRFSTYASWWIRHAISRALADKGRAVRLPVHMIDAYHKIAKSERELQSKLERPATTEEIATATGIEAEKLEKMKTFLAETPVSLDKPISDEDGRRLIDVLVDPNEIPSPPEQMMNSETQSEMIKLLGGLKPIEADILRKRFGLVNDRERTLKEIGDEYHLSRERVRQLQEQALGKMRRAMAKMEPS
ncbi:MAG TPA: sigma-70 family RNA polymerase sigma factor [Polyangia bacterium]